jgi:hypothetical protein
MPAGMGVATATGGVVIGEGVASFAAQDAEIPQTQKTASQQSIDRKVNGAARPTIFMGLSSLEQDGTECDSANAKFGLPINGPCPILATSFCRKGGKPRP